MFIRSFRFKIQIILLVVIIAIFALFVYYSSDIFYQDKRASIYEDLLSAADVQGQELEQYFGDRSNVARMLFMNVNLAKQISWNDNVQLPKRFFNDFTDFRSLKIFRAQQKQIIHSQTIVNRRLKAVGDDVIQSEHSAQKDFEKYKDRGFAFDHHVVSGQWVLSVYLYNRKTFTFAIFEFDIALGARVFSKVSARDSVVFNDNIEPLLMSRGRVSKLVNEIDKEMIKTLGWGVHEITLNNGREYIISIAKVPKYGISVLNLVDKKKAFLSTHLLLARAVRFGIFISFVVALFSFLLTRKIVNPMVRLTEAAIKIKDGNYEEVPKISSKDEIGVLCRAFNDMVATVRSYMEELENQNVILEEKVIERTSELKKVNGFMTAMVNSLDQGLFVIDKVGKIMPLHTEACDSIFGMSINGKRFHQIIDDNSSSSLDQWLDAAYGEMLPFESVTELGPGPIIELDKKHVSFDYYPLRDDGAIKNIVVVATDVTKVVRSEMKLKEKQEETNALLKVLGNKSQFLAFVCEVKEKIEFFSFENAFADNTPTDEFIMFLHSLKGSVSQFGGTSVASLVHDVETSALENSVNEVTWEGYTDAVAEFELFLKGFSQFLGQSLVDGVPRVEIEKSVLKSLYISLAPHDHELSLKIYNEVFLEPIHNYFVGYCSLTRDVAKSLNKSILPFEFENSDLMVNSERFSGLFNSMVHLFRNIADHGIENPDERMEQGKASSGLVKVKFNKTVDKLHLEISDDGGGIDADRIASKLESLGHNVDQSADESSLFKHIFDDQFSTKESATELSGRGVGLSAIREEIEKLGGNYSVSSTRHAGTTFNFEVPFE